MDLHSLPFTYHLPLFSLLSGLTLPLPAILLSCCTSACTFVAEASFHRARYQIFPRSMADVEMQDADAPAVSKGKAPVRSAKGADASLDGKKRFEVKKVGS